MALTAEQKKAILAEYGLHETDTGSPGGIVDLPDQRPDRTPEVPQA